MKKTIYITLLLVTVLFLSCNSKESLSIRDPESMPKIQKIIDDNFNDRPEVYKLQLSAPEMSSSLGVIHREYKFKDKPFADGYNVHIKKFGNPRKAYLFPGRKPFKLSDLDLSIIPKKYEEAIAILEEKKLAKDKDLHLSSWTFRNNRKGEICSDFVLTYLVNSKMTSVKKRVVTYGSFSFQVNSDKSLKFIK